MSNRLLEFGKELPKRGGTFLRVKQKGDSITFRLGQNPVYTGKHFATDEAGKWVVTECPRINLDEKCDTCEKYFEIMKDVKVAKEAGDKTKEEALRKEARPLNVSIMFYFPILNRDTEEFGILQTTFGVRNEINKKYEDGVKIFDRDMILRNTGSESPRDRYSLTVVDSSDSKELTEKEKEALTKARDFDTSTINDGQSNSDEVGDVEIEEKSESVKFAEDVFGDK